MRTVDSLRRSYKAEKLIIAGDMGSSTFRRNLSPLYKQNRKDKYAEQTPEEAAEFEAFLEEVKTILSRYESETNYPVLRFPGVEADDIAAYICSKRAKFNLEQIWLISSDRDWLLNLTEGVSQFSYVTRKEFTVDNWHTHYDYSVEEYLSIKCLMGDSGDNIMGVPGIGPKKALELVRKYGSAFDVADALPINSKYVYINNLNKFGKDNIMLNYQLMDLVSYCAEALGEDNCRTIDFVLEEYLTT